VGSTTLQRPQQQRRRTRRGRGAAAGGGGGAAAAFFLDRISPTPGTLQRVLQRERRLRGTPEVSGNHWFGKSRVEGGEASVESATFSIKEGII